MKSIDRFRKPLRRWILDQCVYIYSISGGIKKVSRDSRVARTGVEKGYSMENKRGPRVRDGDGTGNSRNFRGGRGNLKEILARL